MVRLVVIAGLMAVVSGCFPFAAGPSPCTKTGVDAYGAPVCPLTAAQVSALPEASLIYPGSITLWSNAESGALNVNGEPTDADTYSALETSATPSTVQAWYEDKLRAAGWTHFVSGPHGTSDIRRARRTASSMDSTCLRLHRPALRTRHRPPAEPTTSSG